MSWRRGLLRLWAALSGLWMAFWLVSGIGAGDALVIGVGDGEVFSGRLSGRLGHMTIFSAVLFAPPALLGIVLLLALWVASAFTRPK